MGIGDQDSTNEAHQDDRMTEVPESVPYGGTLLRALGPCSVQESSSYAGLALEGREPNTHRSGLPVMMLRGSVSLLKQHRQGRSIL